MSNVVKLKGRGPSRIVRWVMPDGSIHEQRCNRKARATALWRIHMLGAVKATCLDLFGNVTSEYPRRINMKRKARPY